VYGGGFFEISMTEIEGGGRLEHHLCRALSFSFKLDSFNCRSAQEVVQPNVSNAGGPSCSTSESYPDVPPTPDAAQAI